jgi:hypothetical protein
MLRTEGVTRAVFWSGLAGGVASALPVLGAANCFCCLWAWATGALALYLARSAQALGPGEVPAVGALAGLYAALVAATLQAAGRLLFGPAEPIDMDSMRRLLPEGMPMDGLDPNTLLGGGPGEVAVLVGLLIVQGALFAGFSALGALLADRLLPRPADRTGDGGAAETQ